MPKAVESAVRLSDTAVSRKEASTTTSFDVALKFDGSVDLSFNKAVEGSSEPVQRAV